MIFGEDSERKPPPTKEKRRNTVWTLTNYFYGCAPFDRQIGYDKRTIIMGAIKRMLVDWDEPEIKIYIDRYYSHLKVNPKLAFPISFLNVNLQYKLMIDLRPEAEDDVQRWIDAGFVRAESMVLPWAPSKDAQVKSRLLRDPARMQEIIDEYIHGS